ncbi:MAG: 4-hydroxybenzoate octaprenyltransferase [Legionellales bacterium]|jgi:4-hydroxybenzoate polyprenyltransferase
MKHFIHLMRLDKPIGTLLVLWPVLWALWLANNGAPPLKLLIIFILGALIMRSAGCVVNDIFDRKFDRHVARTTQRPLAQNKLSLKQAWITFFILILLAFLLVLQLNLLTIMLACFAAGLTVLYPLCKRITYLPQLVLGFTFNFGVLMAYSASLNELPFMAWLLFCVSVIWTVAYDTLYAMTDKADDIKIGLKSTAILFGRYDGLITYILYLLFFAGIFSIGLINHLGPVFGIFAIISACWTFYPSKTPLKAFLANNITGLLIFLGFLVTLY